MSKERTSLPAWKQTHRALKDYKPEEMNWPEFMALVAEDFQDGDTAAMIQRELNSGECNGASMEYDDVKSACQAAIREELPLERMGGR